MYNITHIGSEFMNKYDIIIKNIKDNLYKGDKQMSNALNLISSHLF